jgi:hypothetical protein
VSTNLGEHGRSHATMSRRVLEAPNTIGVAFEVFSGDRMVAEAVRSL